MASLSERAREVARSVDAQMKERIEREAHEEQLRQLEQLTTLLRSVLNLPMLGAVFTYLEIEQKGDGPWKATFPVYETEGFRFSLHHGRWTPELGLVLPCPKCGANLTLPIDGLQALGEVLEKDLTPWHSWCSANQPQAGNGAVASVPPTVEQRFLNALRDLILMETST